MLCIDVGYFVCVARSRLCPVEMIILPFLFVGSLLILPAIVVRPMIVLAFHHCPIETGQETCGNGIHHSSFFGF